MIEKDKIMGAIKYNFDKQELENKYAELKTISKMAEYYDIPKTSMSFLFKRLDISHVKKHGHHIDESLFSTETPASLYLAGFIAADGNVDKNLRRITIALAEKDFAFLNRIKELLSFSGNLTKHISFDSRRNEKYKDTISYFLRFSSERMATDLQRFNIIPNKTKTYDFPEWLINHPQVNHFMRGYFDGDGCLRVCDRQLSFSLVGNLSFLKHYQSVLEKWCKVPTNTITKDKNIYVLKYCGNIIVPKICQFLYNNSTFHLDRKYDIYHNHVKAYNAKNR